ncbi:MAG: outer membrane beta-barrel family protein [Bacteroidales bacterium]
MKYLKNLIIIIFPVMLCVGSISAQSSFDFKIKGQIIDSVENKSVPFATISVKKESDKNIKKAVITDEDGKFEITVNEPGNYLLTVNVLGYGIQTMDIIVGKDQKSFETGRILIKSSALELGTVEITGEKPLIKIESDKLSYSAENDPENKTSNALDMLRKVPMVSVDGDDNVQVKGSGNIRIFVNGKPSTMANNNTKDFLKNLQASNIKNIEVITSPGAKYDAEGVGGIINIVMKQATMNGYSATINAGANTLGGANGGVNLSVTHGKLSFSTNISANYFDNPYLDNNSFRDNYADTASKFTTYTGQSKRQGLMPMGNGQISYEIDTLNLISGSFSFWRGKFNNYSDQLYENRSLSEVLNQSYLLNSSNTFKFGSQEASLDFQHTFKQSKDQTLTLSYKINFNPSENNGESTIDSIYNYSSSKQRSNNVAFSKEQTYQADYVQPINENNKFEMGLKYILRNNNSVTDANFYDYALGEYLPDISDADDFNNIQNIDAAYFSYDLKLKKWSLKAGGRVEYSENKGEFASNDSLNFNNTSLEFVPSFNVSYQFTPVKALRFSFTKRIQRPGIWYLNPYVNDYDPQNISYGNPNLDPEHFYNFDLNFSRFGQKTNFNLSVYYSFSNNGIDRVSSITDENVQVTTFENISLIKTLGTSLYFSLRVGEKITWNVNTSANYNNINSTDNSELSMQGWGANGFTNLQYRIGKNLVVSGSGGLFKPPVRLQSKNSPFYFARFNVSQELLKKKLTLSLNIQNVFWKNIRFTSETFDTYFYQKTENYWPGRSLSFNISYRFGELNKQPKKVKNSINNDDVKQGESNNNGGS